MRQRLARQSRRVAFREELFLCSKVWTTTIEKGDDAIRARLEKSESGKKSCAPPCSYLVLVLHSFHTHHEYPTW